MKKYFSLFFLVFFLSGCGMATEQQETKPTETIFEEQKEQQPVLSFPVQNYASRRFFKTFGEFFDDRFYGYHVGDDVEYVDVKEDIPVFGIADGTVQFVDWVSGYGGVMIIRHAVQDQIISAVYGHLDLASVSLRLGDPVTKNKQIAILGDHESVETDGERKHLHFALYQGDNIRLAGYETDPTQLKNWLNPQDFFLSQGVDIKTGNRFYDQQTDLGGEIYQIRFLIPEGWEMEYIPSLQALNLFTLAGKGTARERSQIFIRYFDASSFLTLSTVDVYSTEDLVVGKGNYEARRYDIEKKADIPDFKDQPSWRNERHSVTDFSGKEGFTRYYVVAANPELEKEIYEEILASMEIVP